MLNVRLRLKLRSERHNFHDLFIMTDYAQLITHTPEQEQRWREIAVSNPNRVARVLVLETGQRTREGDTQADIYPALQIVKEISLKAARGGDRAPWENLVKGGIAEALCHSVCSMTIKLEAPRPDTPEELLIKVMNEVSLVSCCV